jgi:hypothetical protein
MIIELGDSPTIKLFNGRQPESLELPDEGRLLAEVKLSKDDSGTYLGKMNVHSEGLAIYFSLYDSTGQIHYRTSTDAIAWLGEQYMSKGQDVIIDNLSFMALDK